MDLKISRVGNLQKQQNRMNSNDSLCDIEAMIATAKAFQQKEKNKALIAEYRDLAKEQGKVWCELNEEEIKQMIIENEVNKKVAMIAKEEAFICSNALKAAQMASQPPSQMAAQPPTQMAAQPPSQMAAQPPSWFELGYSESNHVFDHINYLTKGFTLLDQDYTNWLYERFISRKFTTFGYMPAPHNADVIKQVIGKDGFYFKLTTTNTDVDFIWHDREMNNFLFWGERENVIQAMKIIRSRIIKYSTK
jgi:hypothetical protein